jgi:hypothetical protein
MNFTGSINIHKTGRKKKDFYSVLLPNTVLDIMGNGAKMMTRLNRNVHCIHVYFCRSRNNKSRELGTLIITKELSVKN